MSFFSRRLLMRRLSSCLLAMLLGGWAVPGAQQPSDSVDPSGEYERILASRGAESDSVRLHSLFSSHWRYLMVEYPEYATYVGYPGQNTRWTNNSLQAIARRARELQRPLRVLGAINRRRLSQPDRLSYDLFERSLKEEIESNQFRSEYFAITQLSGPQQDIASAIAAQPAATVEDYEEILARLSAVPSVIAQTIERLEKGLETGITPPKIVLRKVPDQVRNQLVDDPIKSPLLQHFARMPSSIAPAAQSRFRAEAITAYRTKLRPAYQRLLTYLTQTYLPQARETIGLAALPDGTRWYAFNARVNTTTDLSPDRIHQLGLGEVRRIRAAMDSIIARRRFHRQLRGFHDFSADRFPVLLHRFGRPDSGLSRNREADRPRTGQTLWAAAAAPIRGDRHPFARRTIPDHCLLRAGIAEGRPAGILLRQYLRPQVAA